ncbi:flap endonuclease GEN homolog 1-like [Ylistrum balloti]|uniref:flap endonuclease GEN homolog 1-like n=1 Tax=Ylistrum balloti TaxID=509963 RepID=UPI0029059C7B|nr:flap endonuclease GEN homolog 1-like [Ylistrum balloti]
MGVKTLWPVLQEAVDSTDKNVSVQSLQGKRVAVDLSSWIVEFQTVKTKGTYFLKNLYLRSLYYRTTELLGYGIKLIFVADGTAPDMKAAVMKKRQEAQSGGTIASIDPSRSRFSPMIEKCKELLKYLGVPFLYSNGEGEALCAILNAEGLVDGVMTNDVDAFLYGATTVYRDYRSISGVHVVDIYEMQKIQYKLGLDQRTMVVVALLVGCDFCKEGLEGIGIKKALALIDKIKMHGQDPLDRLVGWRNNKELQDLDKVPKSKHCSNCEHEGEKSSHKVEGCGYCETSVSCTPAHRPSSATESGISTPSTKPCRCSWHQRKDHELELQIWTKAKANETFPDQEIIKEYLTAHQSTESPDLTFHPVDISGVKRFMTSYFPSINSTVGEFYSNFAFVLVQLQLHNMTECLIPSTTLTPLRIIHTRKRQAIPHLEVHWSKLEEDKETNGNYYIVTSETTCFQEKFPDMAASFFKELHDQKDMKISRMKRKADDSDGSSAQTLLKAYFKTVK